MKATKKTEKTDSVTVKGDKPRERARYWQRRTEIKEQQLRRAGAAIAFLLGAVTTLKDRSYVQELEGAASEAALKAWPLLDDEVLSDLNES